YRKASPVKLFLLEKVIEIESTDEFAKDKGKAVKRQLIQIGAVHKKKENLLNVISNLTVNVPKIEKEELYKLGIKHYEALRYSRNEWDKIASELYNDEGFLKGKAVNYLWFNCTDYISQEKKLHGRVGNVEARVLLFEIIFNAIKKQYPYLSAKCDEKCKFKI